LFRTSRHFPARGRPTIEGLLSGKERVEAPPQVSPFAKAQREGKGREAEGDD